jgi:hypothetical protein
MENVDQNQNVILTKEQYDALMKRIEQAETKREEDIVSRIEKLERRDALNGRLDRLEEVKPDQKPPVFSGGNMGLSVPYNPPVQKKSGWETFGKIAIGGAIGAAIVGICTAIGGGNSGGTNTFGGSMPD